MKKVLFIITALFVLPIFTYAASVNTSFDSEKCILTVSGSQDGHEAVVSLFDKDGNVLGLKTDTISSNYSTEFVLTYNSDTKIDITVAVEDGNNEVNKNDVNIPACQLSIRTIYSENDDSLTILDPDGSFDKDDVLNIEYMFDFPQLSEDDQATLSAIKSKLTDDQKFVGVMLVGIVNHGNDVNIPDTNAGYKLFLKLAKDDLKDFTNPYIARVIIGEDNFSIEDGIALNYDDSKGGVVAKINNIGIYVLYDNLAKPKEEIKEETDNKDTSNKPNPKTGDNIYVYLGIGAVSVLGFVAFASTKKNKKHTK